MSALLALLSSLLWGTADFLGGTASRRLPPYAVLGGETAVGLLVLLPLVALAGHLDDGPGYLPWAAASGVIATVAVLAFYAALAAGTMGVVAPIAAVGVVIPVAVGMAQGESPSVLQLLGAAVTVAGVVLASGPEIRNSGDTRGGARPIALAFVAAAGFGGALVLIAEGSDRSVPMTLLTMRVVTLLMMLVLAVAVRSVGGLRAGDAPVLVAIGTTELSANTAFAVASTSGLVSLTSVLASLYPAVTVLLARRVHGERMRRIQDVGVVLTLVGVIVIAAGGGAG